MEQWQTFFSWAPKSLQMVTAAMKLKNTLWKKSYDQPWYQAEVHLVKAMVFPVVMYGCESWTVKKAEHRRIDAFEVWCWRRCWESLGLQGDPTSPFWRRSALGFLWKEWCWGCNSNTLATSHIYPVQFRSVVQSCPTLWDPMNHSAPGLPVHHPLPEFTQTHVHSHWCHPAISSSVVPFSSCPQSSQHQSLFQSQLFSWGGQSTGISTSASFLPKKSQGWSPSEWTGGTSLESRGLSRVFSNTTVQKHQFFSAQPSSQSNSHIHMWPQEKP